MFRLTVISSVLFFTAIVNVFVFYISWRRKNSRAGLYFAFGMAGILVWSFGSALDYAAVPLSLKIFFSKLEAVGYISALSCFTLTTISLAGKDRWFKQTWFKVVFIFIPLVNILLVLTNDLHGQVWTRYEPRDNNIFVFVHGPAFTWMVISTYALVALIFATLWIAYRDGSGYARRQSVLLAFALLFPLVTNSIYHLRVGGIEGVDWSSITFSISGFIFLYALYGLRFLDIIRIARDIVLEQMHDGMVVLDDQNRLADFNAAAQSMLKLDKQDLWKPFQATPLARLPEAVALFSGDTDKTTHETKIGGNFFDMRLTVLMDQRGKRYGQLLVLRDVTARKQAELNLQASEAQTRAIVRSVPDLLFRINRQGVFLDFHSRDSSAFYVPPEVFLNQPLTSILPAEIAHGAMQAIEQALDSNQMTLFEYALEINGEVRCYEDRITPLDTDEVLSVIRDITERKRAEKDLEQRLAEIQRLNRELHETQAQVVEQQRTLAKVEERQTMARDMHDSVNQSIHSLALFSETLVVLLKKKRVREAQAAAERIQESGQQALKEIRLLLYKAQTPLVDQNVNLIAALEERFSMVERRVGIRANIVGRDTLLARCPAAWKENLYWIVMEALNNSLKYARAGSVTITLETADGDLCLSVEDDGVGFDPSRTQAGGFGMRSMRERAELMGGSLAVTSEPGGGTRIQFKTKMERR